MRPQESNTHTQGSQTSTYSIYNTGHKKRTQIIVLEKSPNYAGLKFRQRFIKNNLEINTFKIKLNLSCEIRFYIM